MITTSGMLRTWYTVLTAECLNSRSSPSISHWGAMTSSYSVQKVGPSVLPICQQESRNILKHHWSIFHNGSWETGSTVREGTTTSSRNRENQSFGKEESQASKKQD